MRRKIYRSIVVTAVIACSVLVFCTWYVVGVIEKNNVKGILEARVASVSDILYKKSIKQNSVSVQLYDEYKSRTRAFAIMLSENTEIMSNEFKLEEMRMIIGADAISIFDEDLILEYNAGLGINSESILQKFKPAVGNKVFSSAHAYMNNETSKVIVGCSRLDKSGIIQVEYTSDNIDAIMDFFDISKFLTDIPVMKSGNLAIIEDSSMKYIAHTDSEMIGKSSLFDLEKDFFGAKDFFDCTINGEEVLLHFEFCNNQLVIGYIPYSEIYSVRNDTMKWVVVAGAVVATVMILTMRSRVLHLNKKKQNNEKK